MSDPDRLTSHDDMARGQDTRGLILRIMVVAFLGVLFWQAIIAAGKPWRPNGHVSLRRSRCSPSFHSGPQEHREGAADAVVGPSGSAALIAASRNRPALDGQRTPKVSNASRALTPPRMAVATLFSVGAPARAAAITSLSTSAGTMSAPSRSPKIRSPGAMRIP
jgi:hypothetical protein